MLDDILLQNQWSKHSSGHAASFGRESITGETTDNLLLAILRDIRKEQNDHRAFLLNLAEGLRRFEVRNDKRLLALETRLGVLRDDLERMLKSELLGSRAHFETVYEQKLEPR